MPMLSYTHPGACRAATAVAGEVYRFPAVCETQAVQPRMRRHRSHEEPSARTEGGRKRTSTIVARWPGATMSWIISTPSVGSAASACTAHWCADLSRRPATRQYRRYFRQLGMGCDYAITCLAWLAPQHCSARGSCTQRLRRRHRQATEPPSVSAIMRNLTLLHTPVFPR